MQATGRRRSSDVSCLPDDDVGPGHRGMGSASGVAAVIVPKIQAKKAKKEESR
jgi:hypothetical protein